jgi:kynurenine formamidase
MTANLGPPYRFEALYEDEGGRVSRSPWGDADVIGRLNWVTPVSTAKVLGRIRPGPVYDLSVDYFIGMPAWTGSGDPKFEHWMTHTPRGNVLDGLTGAAPDVQERFSMSADCFLMNTHCGTHIDTLTHSGYRGRFWNGLGAEADLGGRTWMRGGAADYPPIVARGVLLDVARLHQTKVLDPGYAITPGDVDQACERQQVTLREGDVVILRTGMMTHWPAPAFVGPSAGMGVKAARYLCEEKGAMCVGTDTVGFEVMPHEESDTFLPVHSYMLAEAGAQILEIVNCERLAADALFEFAFIGGPMRLRGSTGAPLRPIAIPVTAE